ncbi:MAG: hypothetical protein IJR07_09195 [Bacteroidaceae bacterium]|nr:hypothetical protein [Bacteroidaceae bacterium]
MNNNVDFSTMPATYIVCWNNNCPLKDNCLRYLGSTHVLKDRIVPSVNLNLVRPETGTCQMQRPVRKVRVAWGLKHIYDNLTARKKDAIYSQIHYGIGNTTYYHYYNERKPMSPEVQQYIRNVFAQHDIMEPVEFRRYEEVIDW